MSPSRRSALALAGAAAFVLVLVVVRASVQSLTIDESDSFLLFAFPDWPSHWYPSSGNHVLNTILTKLMVSTFGLSHFTLRFGAMLGAVIYLTSVATVCLRLIESPWVRWPLFVCLTLNPFLFDYMTISRGYSLAMAFLLAAVTTAALRMKRQTSDLRSLAVVSACAGASFCSNFSFAYVDALLAGGFLLWCLRRNEHARWRLAAAAVIPGVLVTFILAGSTLRDWGKGELSYGSASLGAMLRSISASSMFQPNPFLVNPLLMPAFRFTQLALPWAFYAAALVLLLALPRVRADPRKWICGLLTGTLAAALFAHWTAFKIFGLPLPKERTGIFFVVLITVVFGIACDLSMPTAFRRFGRATLTISAIYFLGCLRLTYTSEWRFDVDVQHAFVALMNAERDLSFDQVGAGWEFRSTLELYSHMYGVPGHFRFDATQPLPANLHAYVLSRAVYRDFIEKQGLKVIYAGSSDTVVAIRPSRP